MEKKLRDHRLATAWTPLHRQEMTLAQAREVVADHESAVADGLPGQTDDLVLADAHRLIARTFDDSHAGPLAGLPPVRQLPVREEEFDPTNTGLGQA